MNRIRKPDPHSGRSVLPAAIAENATLGILLFLLTLACLRLVSVWARALRFSYHIDYGEPPLLNQIMLLARGQHIYQSDWSRYPFVVTEHPPLYLLLMAAIVRLTGPSFFPGRIVTLAAAITCACLIIWILYRLTREPLGAVVGAGLWLAAPYVLYWSALARLDLVALCLSLIGMAVAVNKPDSSRSALLSAICMTAAVFTRQTYLAAAPLAVAGWYLAHGYKRNCILFLSSLALCTTIVFMTVDITTDGGFLRNIVASNLQVFSLQRTWTLFMRFTIVYAPLIAVAAVTLWRARRDESQATALLGLYLMGAIASSLTIGKIGAGENYFLELTTALSLIGGFAFNRWRRTLSHPGLRAIYLALFPLQVILCLVFGQLYVQLIADRIHQESELIQLQAMVAQEPGPILADDQLGLLVLSGREVLLRPFHFTQLAQQGRWDQTPVLTDIREGHFGMILISDQPPLFDESMARSRWTPEMWEAIHEFYQPVEVKAGTTVLRPVAR